MKKLKNKLTSALPSKFQSHSYSAVPSTLNAPRAIWSGGETIEKKDLKVTIVKRRSNDNDEEKKEQRGDNRTNANNDNNNENKESDGSTEKEKIKPWSKRHHVRFWFLTGSSLLGEFILFIGLFNTCDIIYRHTMLFIPFLIRTFLWAVISIGLMCNKFVNTFWAVSCVFPPWYQTRRCEYHDPWCKHFEMCVLSIISLVAMNMIAVVIQDNLMDSTANNIFKPLFLCTSGLLVYISTGSFIGNSFIWLNDAERQRFQIVNRNQEAMFQMFSQAQGDYSWKLQLMYFGRALLAFFAQVEHQLGAWEIFDAYIIAPTLARDIIYVLIGLLGLQWSKALLMNACVTPFNVPVQPDGLAAIYNMAEKTNQHARSHPQTQVGPNVQEEEKKEEEEEEKEEEDEEAAANESIVEMNPHRHHPNTTARDDSNYYSNPKPPSRKQ